MAIHFATGAPEELLKRLCELIDGGKIKTWSYDADGDFTHTAEQWRNKAWLRPKTSSDRLSFYIIAPISSNISRAVYGIYHGRFIETVLTHADTMFTEARATALAETGDSVASD